MQRVTGLPPRETSRKLGWQEGLSELEKLRPADSRLDKDRVARAPRLAQGIPLAGV